MVHWECRAGPVLVGLALAWQLCGLHVIFAARIDSLPTTSTMVSVLALLMAAVGAALPERAVSLVQKFVRPLSEQQPATASSESKLISPKKAHPLWWLGLARQADPEMRWISLSVLSALAGVSGILSLLLIKLSFELHRGLLFHFFWANLTMAGLEWALTAVILMAPWMLCGLVLVMLTAVTGVHHREPRQAGQWVMAGVLAGLGIGWWSHGPFSTWGMSAEREVMIGALPLLLVAVMAARASQRAESRKPHVAEAAASSPPELATSSEVLTGLASTAWAIGVAATWMGWFECHIHAARLNEMPSTGLGLLLFIVSITAILERRLGTRLGWRADGYGVAVWLCGIGAGTAACMVVWWPDSTVSWWLQVCLLAIPTGYGLRQVSAYWLARAPNVTLGFAHLSITLLTGTAIGLAASRWWGLPHLGAMGTLVAGSLALQSAGGLLELHEDQHLAWGKRLKLAMVFACLAGSILLFPDNTRAWTRRERLASEAARAKAQPSVALWQALREARTACIVGIDPKGLQGTLPPLLGRAELLPWSSLASNGDRSKSRNRLRVAAMPAARWLRLHHSRYQLVYQLCRPPAQGQGWEYTAEWLCVLADHLAVGGQLMVEVPLEGLSRRDIAVLANTFEQVIGSGVYWRLEQSVEPRLTLRAGEIVPLQYQQSSRDWLPLRALMEDASDLPIHSMRRKRILGQNAEASSAILEWVSQRAALSAI